MDQNKAQLDQGVQPEDNSTNSINMETLLEEEGFEIDFPKPGEIRTGVIASKSSGQILVSIGAKSEGMIAGREYEMIPAEDLKTLEVGQEITVFVITPEDQNGNLLLSYTRAREEQDWAKAEALLESKDVYSTKIIGYNKGGLIVPMGNLRGFIPASQVSISRRSEVSGDTPEQRWGEMVGQEVQVIIIEVDRERRRLIMSERAASTDTRETIKDKLIDELNVGDIRKGHITSLADFGAFVNISGADGLVHLSEISWDRIRHPNEVLKVGQEVDVKIISIDTEKKRIGLSIRQLQEDPWADIVSQYKEGQLIEAKITRLVKFGAFAKIDENLEGLIHISEISDKRIEHPKEVIKEGDVLTLRIIKIDLDNHKIGLSLRRVESMAYADMDWQTLLDEDNADSDAVEEDEFPETTDEKAVESASPSSEPPEEEQAGESEEAE